MSLYVEETGTRFDFGRRSLFSPAHQGKDSLDRADLGPFQAGAGEQPHLGIGEPFDTERVDARMLG